MKRIPVEVFPAFVVAGDIPNILSPPLTSKEQVVFVPHKTCNSNCQNMPCHEILSCFWRQVRASFADELQVQPPASLSKCAAGAAFWPGADFKSI